MRTNVTGAFIVAHTHTALILEYPPGFIPYCINVMFIHFPDNFLLVHDSVH